MIGEILIPDWQSINPFSLRKRVYVWTWLVPAFASILLAATGWAFDDKSSEPPNSRRPANERDLRYWLENMVWYHGFSDAEVSDATGERWIITAWESCHRPWANPPCPCLHSDPKFPDCPPGETRRLRGWLSFYEGKDLDAELRRIEQTGWNKDVR